MATPAFVTAPAPDRPAVYMPGGYPFPYYAREDLAYVDGVYDPAVTPGFVIKVTPPTGFMMRILFAHMSVVTSATVADRGLRLQFVDQYNATVWESVASGTVPASTSATLTTSLQYTSAYANGTSFMVPLPDTLLEPGSGIYFTSGNWQAGDQITQLNYYRVLIPTGPPKEEQQAQTQTVIPTPILL